MIGNSCENLRICVDKIINKIKNITVIFTDYAATHLSIHSRLHQLRKIDSHLFGYYARLILLVVMSPVMVPLTVFICRRVAIHFVNRRIGWALISHPRKLSGQVNASKLCVYIQNSCRAQGLRSCQQEN